MNVIFLDVDGVLNIISKSYTTSYYRPDGSVRWMDDHLIQRFNHLVKRTGAKIVISSSWRHDMEDLRIQLEHCGFEYWDEVIGSTPYNDDHRGVQIQDYLDANPEIKCYVVLEDEPQDVCGQKCSLIPKMNVVQVDTRNGLTHQDVDLAYHILTGCESRNELYDV